MDEIETLHQLGREADADLAELPDITEGVLQAVRRRKAKEAGLAVPCVATLVAIGVLIVSQQNYSLDWKMISGSWPGISKYVLFEDSE